MILSRLAGFDLVCRRAVGLGRRKAGRGGPGWAAEGRPAVRAGRRLARAGPAEGRGGPGWAGGRRSGLGDALHGLGRRKARAVRAGPAGDDPGWATPCTGWAGGRRLARAGPTESAGGPGWAGGRRSGLGDALHGLGRRKARALSVYYGADSGAIPVAIRRGFRRVKIRPSLQKSFLFVGFLFAIMDARTIWMYT